MLWLFSSISAYIGYLYSPSILVSGLQFFFLLKKQTLFDFNFKYNLKEAHQSRLIFRHFAYQFFFCASSIFEKFTFKLGQVVKMLLIMTKMTILNLNNCTGWSTECLYDWRIYLKLAIPGFMLILIEWSSFEIATFASGILGNIQLDVMSIG